MTHLGDLRVASPTWWQPSWGSPPPYIEYINLDVAIFGPPVDPPVAISDKKSVAFMRVLTFTTDGMVARSYIPIQAHQTIPQARSEPPSDF